MLADDAVWVTEMIPEASLSTEKRGYRVIVWLCTFACKFFKGSQHLLYDKHIVAISVATKEQN